MKPAHFNHRAFSLVEVCVALAVAAFCLLTLFALLPVGLTGNKQAAVQTIAGGIASEVFSDLQAPQVGGKSPHFGFSIPAPNGTQLPMENIPPQTLYLADSGSPTSTTIGSAPTSSSLYRVSVDYSLPAGSKSAVFVRLLVTWPALADPNPTAWPSKYSGSFETCTALNIN